MSTALMKHGTVSWTVEHKASEYQWSVKVGDDTAEGTGASEPDALREVAWALDWLQGGIGRDALDTDACDV